MIDDFSKHSLRVNTLSSHLIGKTTNFLFREQRERFQQNKKKKPDLMKEWESDSITYKMNNYGYRSNKDFFEGDTCNIYLGCSYVLGDEVKYEDAWPTIVNKRLNDHRLYNLGVSGAGPETCYRILKGFIDFVNVKRVCLLVPYGDRREFYHKSAWYQIKANTSNINPADVMSSIFTPQEMYLNRSRNVDAIKFLCWSQNIPLHIINLNEDINATNLINNDHEARDLLHFGPRTHKKFAEMFLNKIDNTDNLC